MIHIRNLTVRNFMSVGAATQAINFDRSDLTLVLGENLDLGGDGSRNGTGTDPNVLSHTHYTRGREQEWLRSATALEFAQGGLLLLLLLLAAAAATA
jgi:hypothetical protein